MTTIVLAMLLCQASAPSAAAPAASPSAPSDVVLVRAAFGAIDQALAADRPEPTAIAQALARAADAACDRTLGESANFVTPAERAALSAAIARAIRESVVASLGLREGERRNALFALAREATAARRANEILDRWFGLEPGDHRGEAAAGSIGTPAAQLTKVQVAGDLQLVTESARLVSEMGGGGAGNGYVDTGEWVELELGFENASSRPWYSSTVFVRPDSSCLWTPPQGIELAELAAEKGRGALRFWIYVSYECGPAPRKLTFAIRDTHRSPSVDVTLAAFLSPLETPAPRVLAARLDADDLGSSDGSGASEVRPGMRFEYGVDVAIRSGAAEAVSMTYRPPQDLRRLFSSFAYRDVPLTRDAGRVFRAADDLDVTVVGEDEFDRVLDDARESRRWVFRRTPRQLWLAIDSVVEARRPDAAAAASAAAPAPARPEPMAEARLIALVRKHLALVPHPVKPELPRSVSAASGLELEFDALKFAEEYREIVWPTREEPELTPPPPLVYRFRIYQPIGLAARRPPLEPPSAPQHVEHPEPTEDAPTASRLALDIGGGIISYGAQPGAAPEIWGSGSRVEVGAFRARVTVGARAALVVGGSWGWDGSRSGSRNFSEKEAELGFGYRLYAASGFEVMPHATALVRARELAEHESTTTVGLDAGITGRVHASSGVGVFLDVSGRVGPGGLDDLVSGSGFAITGGVSISL